MPQTPISSDEINNARLTARIWIYVAIFTFIIVLTCLLQLLKCPDLDGLRQWIELINGATWPNDHEDQWVKARCPFWYFDFVIALKLSVSIGAMLALFAVPTEYFIRRKGKTMTGRQMLQSQGRAAVEALRLALHDSPVQCQAAVSAVENALEDWERAHNAALPLADLGQEFPTKEEK